MKKILIIDDDVDMCILLSRYLTQNNYETVVADSGKIGMEKFREQKFDIVLCDYLLGEDKDGIDILKQIKGEEPATIVLIITAFPDVKTAVEVIKFGAHDYITKPIVPVEILSIINNVMNPSLKSSAIDVD